jgi:hypothetical protein
MKSPRPDEARYVIIVAVHHDRAFKRFFEAASHADMPLFRGMFLSVTLSAPIDAPVSPTTPNALAASSSTSKGGKKAPKLAADSAAPRTVPDILSLGFQHTFLPKFENERQDASIADEIVAAADARYMVATVKHSGSLNTLSHDLMGAKNSINNEFTGVGVLLLHAHYRRAFPCAPWPSAFLYAFVMFTDVRALLLLLLLLLHLHYCRAFPCAPLACKPICVHMPTSCDAASRHALLLGPCGHRIRVRF